ncbi:nucleotide-diphospho-sugar transferase family protein [Rhynchospora pubera]|uniref:Nucleotide-diphospho-sugar transferase family protein n=1 Tax=Rhynchospora pubera TaxID=906938 RepID=A0AAV8GSE1_9POAL|nr:nucleotide-diphospho-sugar transferase family protein [Rhynchospora pubera]
MTSESINKTKRPIIQYAIGTTFLASILVVYVFTQPSTKFIDRVARDEHGAEKLSRTAEEMPKLQTSKVLHTQEVQESSEDNFASMLQKAATDDKIVILTEVNEAFAAPNSMLDLFLESFHNGDNIEHLLDHLIIVAMDQKAFEKCNSVHRLCYLHEQIGSDLSSEKAYLSKDYLDLVWSKVRLWQFILEQGYSFLFTDVDAMWFRNPFRHISVYADLTLATDVFYGNPEDHNNMPNTGLVFAKPTRKNIEVLKYWREARKRFPTTNEQTVYDKIKHELVSKFQLKVQYVSTAYWGNFCQPQKDFTKLSTFHACCHSGLAIKLAHIKSVIEEWKMYKSIYLKS